MKFYTGSVVLAVLSTVAVLATAQLTPYNSNSQVCCNGSVSEKGASGSWSCCGSAPYDYDTQLCCINNQDFEVVDRPSADPNITSYSCCYDPMKKTSVAFDYLTEVCCDGEPITKPNPEESYGCCNHQLYNWTTHLCCGGEPVSNIVGQGCCGGETTYDINTEVCCEHYGNDEAGIYKLLGFALNSINGTADACCGMVTFDPRTEACCDNEVKTKIANIGEFTWESCCGGEPYDYSTEICCTQWGEIAPNHYGAIATALQPITQGGNHACCGLELYDFQTQVCCPNQNLTVLDKPEGSNPHHWMSCCGTKVLTNHTIQVCYENQIFNRTDYNENVCGDIVYDTREQICCGGELFPSTSTMECCYGVRMYDPATEKCCVDVVEPLSDQDIEEDNNACCAVQSYNFQEPHFPAGR